MKTIAIAAAAIIAGAALPANAKTVTLAGLHPLKKVQAMCRLYGGDFSMTGAGHGCAKAGYGTVWCSKKGKCVARLEEGVKLAGN